MSEGCRSASRHDLERIVSLARALREEVVPLRGGSVWSTREARPEPFDSTYAALLDDPDVRVVVGTYDGAPVGFGVGEIVPLHDGRRLGLLSDLYVEPEARGVGIGEAMADDLVAFLAGAGCVGVDSWALPGHRMTKNFFEQHGFVSRLIVVHRPLGPSPSEPEP